MITAKTAKITKAISSQPHQGILSQHSWLCFGAFPFGNPRSATAVYVHTYITHGRYGLLEQQT